MKVAVVHEWLSAYAGSEKVLEQILTVYPKADLFAVCDFLRDEERARIGGRRASTTFIQRMPLAQRLYRAYLPLMPIAIEQLDLSDYELVISSSHAVAKGVITGPDQLHISYVHSPMRYAWDLQHQYLREGRLGHGVKAAVARWILHRMRMWDVRTSFGVDAFIANSQYVARRIAKVYRREAMVINPPVDVGRFHVNAAKETFYLAASRMVPYKRLDVVIDAFAQMPGRKLVVIGDGPERRRLERRVPANVALLGYQPERVLAEFLGKARAFVFAAEEDFGILPVEAQACGTPVIAFGRGGAVETILALGEWEEPTGLFFSEQTVSAVCDAVEKFEQHQNLFRAGACRRSAERFSVETFRRRFAAHVEDCLGSFCLKSTVKNSGQSVGSKAFAA